ncbi:MAG TPA: ATP-binding protein [Actinomycetota bacterium]|nr:ATP-binding protein [Actinomycetota bacterium]
MADVAVRLRPDPASIPEARHAVDRLQGVLEDAVLQDLRLMVSEVVTNSVRHAGLGEGDRIELRISVDKGRVRVEVHDTGPGFERPSEPTTMFRDSGWGLYLVDRLADRWGITSGRGTTVWFELSR